ncbi:MAG: IclR family transcriptional regulator [Leucobacter sp.]
MSQPNGYRERNSTADRALNVLQMFTEQRSEISAIEVAEALGVARSTAYRYLQTLVQSGFLTESGRGGFRLGLRVLELARIARRGVGLTEVCLPKMRELADEFHHTVLLTKLMGNSAVCLEREESTGQYVRLSYERGSILQIHAGASALALLIGMSEEKVRRILSETELRRFTPNTLTDPDEIVERLRQASLDGFVVTDGAVDPIAMGIAAPITRAGGEVVAAISVVLIRSLVDEQQISTITDAVVAAGAELSERVELLEL